MRQHNKLNNNQKSYAHSGRLLLCSLAALLLLFTSSCQEVSKTKEIKLSHSLEMSHPVHIAMEHLAKRVKENSGGKLTVKIYPNGQLGSERESVELLQIGSLGMTKVSTAVMESFSPNFKVFSLPYIFKDKAHYYEVLDGQIGDDMLKEGEKYWLRGLTYYDAGSRSFYVANKAINTPADLKGLKIRVQASNTAINMVKAFGGAATPISAGEIYTALQQGVVDGAENNSPTFYLSRHYEVAKHYSLNEHTMVPDILLISTVVWDKLSPQEQQWLQEAADESAVVQRELWHKAEQEALDSVKAAGVKINIPDKAPFAKMVEPLYESYKSEPEVYSLIHKIQDAGNK
ncbi:tripartite ATP-independent transporter DctP family solute receptor [Pontibacter ummariensis]|uniref:Tripartite ATP-independent transporter solute receptor, DctP family n=1 Tax=Pontibacter ummariensis TaxID=1610492 RepID=A0A239H206_9BACT|nr:TRAP transporter substrate-binding protein [Pontibacter ummariensis]PRY10929.1 tripartite ATP-independent transporter DctP family solute receptor [Pontibacter ummariensis]SNS75155.1 tripartite ATP-independent transporter solute receptor, DctP family [Pontibacter ummariensis]